MKNLILFWFICFSFFYFTLKASAFSIQNESDNFEKKIDNIITNSKDVKDIVGEKFVPTSQEQLNLIKKINDTINNSKDIKDIVDERFTSTSQEQLSSVKVTSIDKSKYIKDITNEDVTPTSQEEAIKIQQIRNIISKKPVIRTQTLHNIKKHTPSREQSDESILANLLLGFFCTIAIVFTLVKIVAIYNFFRERNLSFSKSQEITKNALDDTEAIQLLLNNGYHYEAIERLEPILRKKEEMTSQLYALAGLAYMQLKNSPNRTPWKDFFIATQYFNKIPELFENALALDKNNQLANLFLCEYYININSYKKAIVALENAIKIFPEDLTLHNYLGLCYQKEDRLEDAIREFLIVADVLRDEKSYENLALVFFMNNQFDSAKHFIKLVLQKNPNNENVKILLERINNPPVPIGKIITDFIKRSPFVLLYSILSVLLLIAVDIDRSKSYYMLLRLITSGVCVYSTVKLKTEWMRWIFGGLAVLYNPIFPIHLGDKDIWSMINIATIVYMWIALFIEKKQ